MRWRACGVTLITVGVVGLLLVVGFTSVSAWYQGFDYKCLVEGPFRSSPPFALVSEAVEVRGYFSVWPLGRACDWQRADGAGFVTAGPDWIATGAAIVCLALAVLGRVVLTMQARRHGFAAHRIR